MHTLEVTLGPYGNHPRNKVVLDGKSALVKSLVIRAAVGEATSVTMEMDAVALDMTVEDVQPRFIKQAPSYFEYMAAK